MNLDLIRIIVYVLGGLSIAMAAIAVILFFNLKIVDAIKELNGVVVTDTKKSKKFSVKAINGSQASNATVAEDDDEDEEEGIDKTVALVADENTYTNFKILKNIIYVNTTEVIS